VSICAVTVFAELFAETAVNVTLFAVGVQVYTALAFEAILLGIEYPV
jgi:hypothetical protein